MCSFAVLGFLAQIACVGAGESPSFEVANFTVKMEDRPPSLIERQGNLQIVGAYINVCATIRCIVPGEETWCLGFIQQIDKREQQVEYSNAICTWELPAYPFCDSSTNSTQCPWYDKSGTSVVSAKNGPVTIELSMNDNLSMYSSWKEPRPQGMPVSGLVDLRGIRRVQQFTLWLAARRENDGKTIVLRRVRWESSYQAKVSPDKPIGNRAEAVTCPFKAPVVDVMKENDPAVFIPPEILNAKRAANDEDEFWWNPKPGTPGQRAIIIPKRPSAEPKVEK